MSARERRIRLTTAQLVENLEGMDACYDAIAWVRSQPTPARRGMHATALIG